MCKKMAIVMVGYFLEMLKCKHFSIKINILLFSNKTQRKHHHEQAKKRNKTKLTDEKQKQQKNCNESIWDRLCQMAFYSSHDFFRNQRHLRFGKSNRFEDGWQSTEQWTSSNRKQLDWKSGQICNIYVISQQQSWVHCTGVSLLVCFFPSLYCWFQKNRLICICLSLSVTLL